MEMVRPSMVIVVIKIIEVVKFIVIFEDTVKYGEDAAYRYVSLVTVIIGSVVYVRTIESAAMGMSASAV